MSLHVVILAAGLGKRMYSKTPKVLHPLAGKAMLQRVVETAKELAPEKIHVIVGHGAEMIKEKLSDLPVNWVYQESQLGTGHAVLQALPHVGEENEVLVLSADVPLIQSKTLKALIQKAHNTSRPSLGLLIAKVANPFGLGRIIRNKAHEIEAIVEEKDTSHLQRSIDEIYSGICYAASFDLQRWLPKLGCNNAQGEYYLTEIISLAVSESLPIVAQLADDPYEIMGVNNRLQMQELERVYQQRKAEQFLSEGLALADASRFDLRGSLDFGQDVFIDVNAVLEGDIHLGEGSRIGPNCYLKNVRIGAHTEIFANSVLQDSEIGDFCQIGPFARVRPGTKLSNRCKIGNFVETKNAVFDEGSKANHLSYVGDAKIGKGVNIGAGTICCNYDGANKHQTLIEDGAFIGSGSQLVAPVKIGANATIGAGSTIRKDAPAGELSLTAGKQVSVPGWKRPKKKE